MPTAYGAEFRQDVIDVARKGEAPLAQIAKDFGLSVTTLKRWIAILVGSDRNGFRAFRDHVLGRGFRVFVRFAFGLDVAELAVAGFEGQGYFHAHILGRHIDTELVQCRQQRRRVPCLA